MFPRRKSLLVHKEYGKYLKIKAEKSELDEEKVKAEEVFEGTPIP